jgi:hypothetical protein
VKAAASCAALNCGAGCAAGLAFEAASESTTDSRVHALSLRCRIQDIRSRTWNLTLHTQYYRELLAAVAAVQVVCLPLARALAQLQQWQAGQHSFKSTVCCAMAPGNDDAAPDITCVLLYSCRVLLHATHEPRPQLSALVGLICCGCGVHQMQLQGAADLPPVFRASAAVSYSLVQGGVSWRLHLLVEI